MPAKTTHCTFENLQNLKINHVEKWTSNKIHCFNSLYIQPLLDCFCSWRENETREQQACWVSPKCLWKTHLSFVFLQKRMWHWACVQICAQTVHQVRHLPTWTKKKRKIPVQTSLWEIKVVVDLLLVDKLDCGWKANINKQFIRPLRVFRSINDVYST